MKDSEVREHLARLEAQIAELTKTIQTINAQIQASTPKPPTELEYDPSTKRITFTDNRPVTSPEDGEDDKP